MTIPRLQQLLAVAAFWALAQATHAQAVEAPPPVSSGAAVPTPPTVERPSRPLPVERNWRFGVGVGYGTRTNPLVLSDDIPIIVDLDIAWFGKRWFFDNFDLGFALADNRLFTANAIARVNSDRVFFGKTNTKYVNFSLSAGGAMTPLPPPPPPPGTPAFVPEAVPQELKVPDRDYAIEMGLEMLFDGEWGQATLRGFHDVSGTHHGFEFSADYSYRWTRGRLSVAPSIGVAYKNDELSDYYWGITQKEAGATLVAYHADGGIDWEAGIRTSYYLTKSTRLALSANYERLHDSVALSPIVEDDYVLGYFAGVAWQF
ncbi:MAG TPA: MipA/OmpV family protein [Steroidobacteraceae bacterium]|nr:MipA/OmpV family protein [Steroidobacteraceae bacterium]